MKKLYIFFFSTLFYTSISAQAPSYVDFELDVFRFGYVFDVGGDADGGGAFGGELRYNATDFFSIGLSGDAAFISGNLGPDVDFGITGNSLIVGDYYLNNTSGQRPFFGLGVGLYSTGSVTVRDGSIEEIIEGTTGAGLAPRAGYEFGHVRLQGQYNLTLKEGHTDYFSVSLAITLWGGYRGSGRDFE